MEKGELLTAASIIAMGLVLNGCQPKGDAISFSAANALGEEIGEGIAHAACIEAKGDWSFGTCRFDK